MPCKKQQPHVSSSSVSAVSAPQPPAAPRKQPRKQPRPLKRAGALVPSRGGRCYPSLASRTAPYRSCDDGFGDPDSPASSPDPDHSEDFFECDVAAVRAAPLDCGDDGYTISTDAAVFEGHGDADVSDDGSPPSPAASDLGPEDAIGSSSETLTDDDTQFLDGDFIDVDGVLPPADVDYDSSIDVAPASPVRKADGSLRRPTLRECVAADPVYRVRLQRRFYDATQRFSILLQVYLERGPIAAKLRGRCQRFLRLLEELQVELYEALSDLPSMPSDAQAVHRERIEALERRIAGPQ